MPARKVRGDAVSFNTAMAACVASAEVSELLPSRVGSSRKPLSARVAQCEGDRWAVATLLEPAAANAGH